MNRTQIRIRRVWKILIEDLQYSIRVKRVLGTFFYAVNSCNTMTRAKVDTVLLLKETRMMCASPPLVVWAIKFRAETSKTAISL